MDIEGVDPHKEHLEQASEQFEQSLKACQQLVADLRNKLAANNNEPLEPDEQDMAGRGEPTA